MWPDLANFCLCGNILDKFGTVWVHFVCHWVTFLAPKACLDLHNSLCKMQYGSPLNYAGKKLSELENLLSHCILRSPFESEQILKNNLSIRSHWFRAIRLECILNRPSLVSLFLFLLFMWMVHSQHPKNDVAYCLCPSCVGCLNFILAYSKQIKTI